MYLCIYSAIWFRLMLNLIFMRCEISACSQRILGDNDKISVVLDIAVTLSKDFVSTCFMIRNMIIHAEYYHMGISRGWSLPTGYPGLSNLSNSALACRLSERKSYYWVNRMVLLVNATLVNIIMPCKFYPFKSKLLLVFSFVSIYFLSYFLSLVI